MLQLQLANFELWQLFVLPFFFFFSFRFAELRFFWPSHGC